MSKDYIANILYKYKYLANVPYFKAILINQLQRNSSEPNILVNIDLYLKFVLIDFFNGIKI